MGTLPTLARTWRFQVNQAIAATGTALGCDQALMYAIKQSLIGAGVWTDSAGAGAGAAGNWVVRSSCSGAGGAGSFGNGDGVDRWAAAANCVFAAIGANHSWMVLRNTGIGPTFELLIDLIPAGGSSAYIATSQAGFALNGSATNRPTAADEVGLLSPTLGSAWGGPGTNVANTLHVFNTTDGKSTRVIACRNGFVPLFWCIEAVTEAPAAWALPSVAVVLGDTTGAPVASVCTLSNLSNSANAYGWTSQVFSAYVTCPCTQLSGVLAAAQVVANDMGASWAIYPQGIYSAIPNSRGRLAKILDQFFGSTALVDSDTFPAGGGKNFCVFGDTIQPWNTTAPTFGGGVSTARDGEYVDMDPFASAMYLQPVQGAPDATTSATGSAQFQMEASDSVTGVLYTWMRPYQDYSGTGYPGPNSPIKIALSSTK